MPELPEVETIRRDLEREVAGRKIKSVEVHGLRSIRRHGTKKKFTSALDGRKITSVGRKGKYLMLKLDDGNVLVIHLGMSGQLLRAKSAREKTAKHTHVVISFTQGGQLRYIDPRTFGELFVSAPEDIDKAVPELAHLGMDPLEDAMSWAVFGRMLQAKKAKLKPLLMDQKFVAGIGNIYSDEILWSAGLRHDRLSDSLTSQEVRRLYRAMVETLQDAVKYRGSSIADEQYVDVFGEIGQYQTHHNVYAREGLACSRCRGTIERMKTGNRSSFHCPSCQV